MGGGHTCGRIEHWSSNPGVRPQLVAATGSNGSSQAMAGGS
jgi:hypothetical protein